MRWFNKPAIEIFVRHCHFSEVSAHKERYKNFSRLRCHENLLSAIGDEKVHITYLLDTARPTAEPHFVKKQTRFPVIEISEGTEAGSFLRLLDYVTSQNLAKETILYFLEDDYLHRPGFLKVLKEGFTLPGIDYITLYDHKDKYSSDYATLRSTIYHTETCHWRETPSTTNTYAMRYETLLRDLEIHRAFSLERKISQDHEKFLKLAEKGAYLASCIPGFSTHAEPAYASPCTNWQDY